MADLVRGWELTLDDGPHRVRLAQDSALGFPSFVDIDGRRVPVRLPYIRLRGPWVVPFQIDSRPAAIVVRRTPIGRVLRRLATSLVVGLPLAFIASLVFGPVGAGGILAGAAVYGIAGIVLSYELRVGERSYGDPGLIEPDVPLVGDAAVPLGGAPGADGGIDDAALGAYLLSVLTGKGPAGVEVHPEQGRHLNVIVSKEKSASGGWWLVARIPFGSRDRRSPLLGVGWQLERTGHGTRHYVRRFQPHDATGSAADVLELRAAYRAIYGQQLELDRWAVGESPELRLGHEVAGTMILVGGALFAEALVGTLGAGLAWSLLDSSSVELWVLGAALLAGWVLHVGLLIGVLLIGEALDLSGGLSGYSRPIERLGELLFGGLALLGLLLPGLLVLAWSVIEGSNLGPLGIAVHAL